MARSLQNESGLTIYRSKNIIVKVMYGGID
jgi:hypothetical protein